MNAARKVAVIGCGFVADSHISCIKRIPGAEIVGIADKNTAALARIASKFDIHRTYTSTDELYARARPDVIHVLTPTQTHAAVTLEAMRYGCDVLLEKPMASCASESQMILDSAIRYGRVLSVCHNFLYLPAVEQARAMLAEGALGELIGVDISWRPPARGFHVDWLQELPGGALHEILPHAIYLQRAFVGETVNIAGLTRRGGPARSPGCELHVLLDGERGTAHIEISPRGQPKQFLIRIEGTRMSLQVDLSTNTIVKIRKLGEGKVSKALMNLDQAAQLLAGTLANVLSVIRTDLANGHFPLIRDFYDSLRNAKNPAVSGEDGHATVVTLDRIWATPDAIGTQERQTSVSA